MLRASSNNIRPVLPRMPQQHVRYMAAGSIKKLMAANRGEIAVRIMRAGNNLGVKTVGIFSHEDRFTQHRYKADESYLVGQGKSPVGAYLDIPSIINVCKQTGTDAVHPGYGFLSENTGFALELQKNNIAFVGPTAEQLQMFGDKTSARELAIKCNVPVVAGTPGPISTYEDAKIFIEEGGVGYPVIIKASMGGGGRGMRVVNSSAELKENFARATSEALAAFGDGTVFIEKYVKNPRHIEVQMLGDGTGDVVHFFTRDCSVQRRHQKVLETAPATSLPDATLQQLYRDSLLLCQSTKYRNAGTVEFLVDEQGKHYFIEVNPRIQVEHTISEQITGYDIVANQIKIAGGETLKSLGITQDKIHCRGHAMQCRITTENPQLNFQPTSGTLEVFRAPAGMGVRVDDGPGFVGATITPYYDSLLLKLTCSALERQECANKLLSSLNEFRVRGVTTNKSFLANVLKHPDFLAGNITTSFIAENPDLLNPLESKNRGQKLLNYLSQVIVNGPEKGLGANLHDPPSAVDPIIPVFKPSPPSGKPSLRSIYVKDGPKAFAKAVRDEKKLLITDTTWRDAHQSLLATRVRTRDLKAIAPATAIALKDAYSLECWGGATFDVTMRFLREDPWDRLMELRELVPDIPFQMLLRGANAVGYTSYPDNVVYKFCELAQRSGMDVFRVFDSLNYIENMRLGIDAVGQSGGIIEASVCYTGDVSDPKRGPYTLDYYLEFARQLNDLGIHVLNIKDMAGLLKPKAATMLVEAMRKEFPNLPIHVHCHDTAGTGVASMLACARAGADAVDVACDSMSGTTSQPSMGALVMELKNDPLDTEIDLNQLSELNEYWETTRGIYAPFESGQKSGSADVYVHEMPGGQYTNLLFQSKQLGLSGQWSKIKKAYATANRLLGDIIKVTPSSKVAGDFAQFIVQNNLTEQQVIDKAEELNFPNSVVEYFQGYLGIPPFGFPEPLRSRVLKGRLLPNGKSCFEGRPGAELPPFDFEKAKVDLEGKYGPLRDVDIMSHIQYPNVFKEFMTFKDKFGSCDILDTRSFVVGMEVGQEKHFEVEKGKTMYIKLVAVGKTDENGERDVIFEMNGVQRDIKVSDANMKGSAVQRKKADVDKAGSVGAAMPGVVVEVRVKKGDEVKKGAPLVILSAMKMETVVGSPCEGKIVSIDCVVGDNVAGGDLLCEIE
mmetsp:Transcript_7009/g.17433  ORF Transcript_7009/g.17433 Transcript_7009/m.17433 type:complete len:1180 (+) Transcript_7009:186-3725(+)